MTLAVALLVFLVITLVTSLIFLKRKNNYWEKRGVVHLKPLPVFGNYKNYLLLKNTITEVVNKICDQFPDKPYIGAFYGTEPTLIVRDPEYIKLVLAKDFYFFNSRENADYSTRETLTDNLFFTSGNKWKVLRQNLTPFFSPAKMKRMFYLIEQCNVTFNELLDREMKNPTTNVRSMMARYTIDSIGTCVFGVNTKAMSTEDGINPFREIGYKIFEPTTSRGLKLVGRAVWPALFYKLGLQAFPSELTDFFDTFLKAMFQQRQYKPSGRHDFVDLVLEFMQNKYITGDSMAHLKENMTKTSLEVNDRLLCGLCTVLYGAGFETSATTSSLMLFELAKNPEKQKLAIEEVDNYFDKHDKLIFECIYETPYLEACFYETLRLYPVLGVITRELIEDYTMPPGVPLTKGVRVHIPVYHLHNDPKYFPEPEKFMPERFLGENKDNITPFSFMPFGEGPRICIGMRFSKMQVLSGMLTLLKKCRVELASDMKRNLDFDPRVITTQPTTGIYLKLIPR